MPVRPINIAANPKSVLIVERYRCEKDDYLAALVLYLMTFGVYLLTFSPMPTSDGLTEAIRIQTGDPVGLFRAVKLLYQPMGYALYRLCQSVGLAISPIQLLQTMNTLVGSAVVAGFFLLLLRLFGDRLAAVIGAALLAFSHSFWFYLNGEVHVFSVACLLAASWVLLSRDLRATTTWVLTAAMHGLAILFHLDNVGFGGVVLALFVGSFLKGRRFKAMALYACVLLLVVTLPYYLAGRILDPQVPPWSYWTSTLLREVIHDDQFVGVNSPLTLLYELVRVAKGQGTALTIGVDVLADLARNHSEYTFTPHLLALLGMMAGVTVLLAVVLARGWRQRRDLWHSFRSLIVLAVIWFVSLEIVHYFWAPSLDEYHVTTLPPLVVLWMMGLLTQDGQGTWRIGRKMAVMGGALVLLVFTINLVGIVLPWKQFGDNILRTAAQVQEISREGALFITPDSSVNLEYFADREVKTLKYDLFEGIDTGLDRVGLMIEEALSEGLQVYLFRWLRPSEFFFDDYNVRNQDDLAPQEFKAKFQTWAVERYKLIPVVYYWEWETRYEAYGNRNAIIYRVEPLGVGQSP